ncbi:MAG: RNA-binding cell elongation regulator Jag/EloR [Christensenellales bacterium]
MRQNQIEIQAKTVDEAIFRGLQTLQCTIDEVEVDVLQEANKGLFGIGARECTIRLTRIQQEEEATDGKAQDFLGRMLSMMGVGVKLQSKEDDECLRININGNVSGILIGRRGETLDALQYLTSVVYNRKAFHKRVILDTENYRSKREDALVRLAGRLSSKVRVSGEPFALEPMTPYERRILHAALQDDPDVTTCSEGEEPNRYVVVMPKEAINQADS